MHHIPRYILKGSSGSLKISPVPIKFLLSSCRMFTISHSSDMKFRQIPTEIVQMRTLSTVQNPASAFMATKDSRGPDWLMSYFPEVFQIASERVLKQSNPETTNHFAKALQYTIAGGKRVRGLTVTRTYEAFAGQDKQLTPANLKLAGVLGICLEMSQAWLLALDDIVDESKVRRGQPCWYLKEGVGMGAINDSVLISKMQYHVLKKYFGHLRCYPKLMETFNEGELTTMCGQTTDFLSAQKPLDQFKMDHYKSIAMNKTAFYTFNLPAALGMTLANVNEPAAVEKEIHSILQEIGCYYQIQDDFLDCFGDENFKKVGNDIEERKCTWLAVKFMELANDNQKNLYEKIYGSSNPEDVAAVKNLYRDVGIIEAYKTFGMDSYQMIKEKIELLPSNIPKELFHELVDNIHARNS